jgi:hypothetical protein
LWLKGSIPGYLPQQLVGKTQASRQAEETNEEDAGGAGLEDPFDAHRALREMLRGCGAGKRWKYLLHPSGHLLYSALRFPLGIAELKQP